MQHASRRHRVRAGPGRRRAAGARGAAAVARIVRLLTAVCLLGSVLLVVALVGQGAAGAGDLAERPATAGGVSPAGAPALVPVGQAPRAVPGGLRGVLDRANTLVETLSTGEVRASDPPAEPGAGDGDRQPAPGGEGGNPTAPQLAQADIPQGARSRLARGNGVSDGADAARAARQAPGKGRNPARRAEAPPVWPTQEPPAQPRPAQPWRGPKATKGSYGTIGQAQPVDYGKILQDPRTRVLFAGIDAQSTASVAALIDALPVLKEHGVTDLALPHPRDLDRADRELMLGLAGYYHSWTGHETQDLMIRAWSLGMRVWGMEPPLRSLMGVDAGPDPWKDKWPERTQSIAVTIDAHLRTNAENDPQGDPGRVLAVVPWEMAVHDPSILPLIYDSDRKPAAGKVPSVYLAPSAPSLLADAGWLSTVVQYHAGDGSYPTREHAQVEGRRMKSGGVPFAVGVSGEHRLQDWIVYPGEPDWLQPDAVPDPVATGQPPWSARRGPSRQPPPAQAPAPDGPVPAASIPVKRPPTVWPRQEPPAQPQPGPAWTGPRAAMGSFGTIGKPRPLDDDWLRADPRPRVLLTADVHPSRETIDAVRRSLRRLREEFDLRTLLVEYPRDVDRADMDLFLDSLPLMAGRWHRDREMEDLVLEAWSLGIDVQGWDVPFQDKEEQADYKDKWYERNLALGDAAVDALVRNAARDPNGDPGMVLALAGMAHTVRDPTVLGALGAKDEVPDPTVPSASQLLTAAGIPNTVLHFHVGDTPFPTREHAQVEAQRMRSGGVPFAVGVSGPRRFQDVIAYPGEPDWRQPEDIPDPVAAGQPLWMTQPTRPTRPAPRPRPGRQPHKRTDALDPETGTEREAALPAPAPQPSEAFSAAAVASLSRVPPSAAAAPPAPKVSLTLEGGGELALPDGAHGRFLFENPEGRVYQLSDGRIGLLRDDGTFSVADVDDGGGTSRAEVAERPAPPAVQPSAPPLDQPLDTVTAAPPAGLVLPVTPERAVQPGGNQPAERTSGAGAVTERPADDFAAAADFDRSTDASLDSGLTFGGDSLSV